MPPPSDISLLQIRLPPSENVRLKWLRKAEYCEYISLTRNDRSPNGVIPISAKTIVSAQKVIRNDDAGKKNGLFCKAFSRFCGIFAEFM